MRCSADAAYHHRDGAALDVPTVMPVAHHRDLAQYRKRHRNRRKHLRAMERAGKITSDERAVLTAESREACRLQAAGELDLPERSAAYHRAVAVGEQYMAGHSPNHSQGWCNPECVGADGPTCVCWCEGVNHAAGRVRWEDIQIPGGRARKAEIMAEAGARLRLQERRERRKERR